MEHMIDRPLLAVPNCNDDGQLLMYDVSVVAGDEGEDSEPTTMTLEMRPFPCSFAGHRCCALAVSGSSILALTYSFQDTVVYDTVAKAAAPGPRLHDYKPATPAMVPVGDDTVVVMNTVLPGPARCCSFEALRRQQQLPGEGGGGVWRAFRLPEPPLDIERGRSARVSAYLALGTRVWISVTGEGTFSLDVVNGGSWRREGAWELPLYDRAMFVPELGSVIGITNRASSSSSRHGGHCLCALDMEVRPPVLRHVWEETFPSECLQAGHLPSHDFVSLAHLGNGAFCVCRPINVERDARGYFTRSAISFMAVQLMLPGTGTGTGSGRELQLTRRGKVRYCGDWVRGCPFPYFIQT